MLVKMITPKIIEVGTSFFMIVSSGHCDLPNKNAVPETTSAVESETAVETTTETEHKAESAGTAFHSSAAPVLSEHDTVVYEEKTEPDFNTDEHFFYADTISVSSIKLTWNIGDIGDYTIMITQTVDDGYIDNIYFEFKSDNLCYVNGLREGMEYDFDILDADENIIASTTGSTETVEVIQEYEYEDGWTNCFSYENAKGLTRDPSWSAIQGAEPDKVTNTGIMRDEYGDYCCAMGTFYGYCGDRFLVTLENGTQFTVKICDSKGNRRYHNFGNGGKSVVEFIHADGYLPDCTKFSGNYGLYNWFGLDLGANIESIKMINYGEPVEY